MSEHIAVVGSHGRMGALFCREWTAAGHTVRGVDRVAASGGGAALGGHDLDRAVTGAAVVVLCVPAPAMDEVLALVTPRMDPGALLADICSVKVLPMRAMEASHAGPVVGTHPLFGPGNNRQGAKVALVPGTRAGQVQCDVMAKLFRAMGCETFTTTAEEHDAASAVSQSLHFTLSAAYFATVNRFEGIETYITPSFKRYMNAARKELTVNAAMFREFTEANPLFPATLAEVTARIDQAGKGGLDAIIREACAWYATHAAEEPDSGQG